MNSYSKKLIEMTKTVLAEGINDASVVYTFVQLNKAIQDSGCKSEFTTINFYRDWLVHTDLDHNRSLVDFFKLWDNIIEGISEKIGVDAATEGSIEPLRFEHLFEELTSLGVNLQTNNKGLFIKALVENLLDTPIRWQGKYIKEFRFTFDSKKKQANPTYFCHIQIQHAHGSWFDGPEFHYAAIPILLNK